MNDIQQYFFDKTGKVVNLPPKGNGNGDVKIKCPFCNDSRRDQSDRSMSLNLITGAYHCHYQQCNEKGYAKPDSSTHKRPAVTFKVQHDPVKDWLVRARGLAPWLIDTDLVGSAQKGGRTYVTFNYYFGGRHVNTKYRPIDRKEFRMEPDAMLCLYNGDVIKEAKEYVIITEGEPDALAWISVGFANACSVPNGANANTSYLDHYIKDLDNVETVYISGDQEESGTGYKLALQLADRIGREKCRLVRYPDGIKDANAALQEGGEQLLRECFESAVSFPLEHIITAEDAFDETFMYMVYGWPETLSISIPGLKDLFSLYYPEVTIVTGAPGSGKSNLMDAITVDLARMYGIRTGFVSAEKSPGLHNTEMSFKYLDSDRTDAEGAARAISFLNDHVFHIMAPSSGYTIEYILDKGYELMRSKGIKALVIDNLSCVQYDDSAKGVSELMSKLTSFAKKFNIHIFLVAHPKKMESDIDGVYKLPSGYDVLGSSHFYNLVDNIIVLRIDKDEFVDIGTRKIRNLQFVSPCGKLGVGKVMFRRERGGNYQGLERTYKPKRAAVDHFGMGEQQEMF